MLRYYFFFFLFFIPCLTSTKCTFIEALTYKNFTYVPYIKSNNEIVTNILGFAVSSKGIYIADYLSSQSKSTFLKLGYDTSVYWSFQTSNQTERFSLVVSDSEKFLATVFTFNNQVNSNLALITEDTGAIKWQ